MENVYIDQLRTRRTFFMTKSGLDNLKERLDTLMRDRFEAVKRMRAMDYDDKADPLALVDEVRRLEASEIEATKISNLLQYVEPIAKSVLPRQIQVGSEVTLQHGSKKMIYTIVCPLEIDIEAHKISEESPLGRVLIGKKIHETIVVPLRKEKECAYEVIDIN